jgi:hypothetical protein
MAFLFRELKPTALQSTPVRGEEYRPDKGFLSKVNGVVPSEQMQRCASLKNTTSPEGIMIEIKALRVSAYLGMGISNKAQRRS